GDNAPEVRAEAAIALSFRPTSPATVEAQRKALMSDTSIKVRENVLSNLWNARDQYPKVKELVIWVASKDPAKDMREMAERIIATYPDEFPKGKKDLPTSPISKASPSSPTLARGEAPKHHGLTQEIRVINSMNSIRYIDNSSSNC